MSEKRDVDSSRIELLEAIRNQGKTWDVIAPRYGVTNPNPPWKTSLGATCDCLGVCGALPALERRNAEDDLAEAVYSDVPDPERQLLALAHTMLSRGLVTEEELASRMRTVRARLTLPMLTNRRALGQLILCKGCCCGRTDRGLPEVPVQRIKELWRREKLNRSIQLTISDCLGPCDVPNVALILTPDRTEWLCRIAGDASYDSLIQWVRDCHAAGALAPIPEQLADNRLERFAPKEAKA